MEDRNERWLICGGQKYGVVLPYFTTEQIRQAWEERTGVALELDHLVRQVGKPSVVITGGATGADTLGDSWRRTRGYPGHVFEADWNRLGKRAGIVRNTQMLTTLRAVRDRPKRVIAFPGNNGTLNMIAQALAAGIEVTKLGKWT